MKLKTKLISVLGAAAIATTGLGVIASCTFTRKTPEGPYEAPKVTHNGWSELTTQEHQTEFTISGFHISRNFRQQERIAVTATPVAGGADIEVTKAEPIYDTNNTFSIKITLGIPPGEEDAAHMAKFKFDFVFKYNSESKPTSLDKVFTVTYPEFVNDNSIAWTGAEADKHFDFTKESRGQKVYEIAASNFTLKEEFAEGDMIDVQTSNSLIKATIGEVAAGQKHVPVTLEIVNYPYYDDLNIDSFSLTFSINQKKKPEIGGFSLSYSPEWQTNQFVFRGEDSTFYAADGEGAKEFETDYFFRLDRELNAKNSEYFEIKVLDETGQESKEIELLTYGDPQDLRYYNFKLRYKPNGEEDYENKFIKFYFEIKFFDAKGGSNPVSTQILYGGTKETNKYFCFYYQAPWNPNELTCTGETVFSHVSDGVSSIQFGTLESGTVLKFQRPFKVDLEDYDVSLQGDGAISNLNLDSYHIVKDDADNCYLDLVISVKDTSRTTTSDFSIVVNFYEFNTEYERTTRNTSTLNNFKFAYAPKITRSLSVNNGSTAAGKNTLNITGSFNEALDSDETISSVTSSNEKVKPNSQPTVSGRNLTFATTLTVADTYTREEFKDVTFTITTNKGSYTSNAFTVTYSPELTPWEEETEEEFTVDRTFAVGCYLDYYGYADSDMDGHIGNMFGSVARATFSIIARNVSDIAKNPYRYYMATTWNFKESFEKMKYYGNKWDEEFVVKFTDQNLSKDHTLFYDPWGYGPTKQTVHGSLLRTDPNVTDDYIKINPAKITWVGQPNDYLRWNVSGKQMGANIYIADVDFTGTDILKNTKIKAKLDALNEWQQRNAGTGGPQGRINQYVDKYPYNANNNYMTDWGCFTSYSYRYETGIYYVDAKETERADLVKWDVFTNYQNKYYPNLTSSFKPFHTSQPANTQSQLKYLGNDSLFLTSRHWKYIDADVDKKYWHGCYSYFSDVDSYYWTDQNVYEILPGGLFVARKNGSIYVLGISMGAPDGGWGNHPWYDSYVGATGGSASDDIFYKYYEDHQSA